MIRIWGRKTSDVGPGGFFLKLEHECAKNGCSLVKRDKYFASTQTCSECGHRLEGENRLTLKDREWTCPECGEEHNRDENAAINILTGGASSGIRAASAAEEGKMQGNTRAASAA